MVTLDCSSPSSPANKFKTSCRSPFSLSRIRSRRWRQSRSGTAAVVVAALLVSTTAWLSLLFSGTTSRCWHHFRDWEGGRGRKRLSVDLLSPSPPPPLPPRASSSSSSLQLDRNRSLSEVDFHYNEEGSELSLKHILFGIAGSSQLWGRRKEFVRLWWRPKEMRGHVWLDEQVAQEDSLPRIMISEDTSRFRYTNPTGHPSGLRISRIILESFRLGLPGVRWFVLGDDDTIFNADNLVAVLSKYDSSEMVYVGAPSESHSANTYFSHSMAYGGGGIAISYPLAQALSNNLDDCLDRYHKLYGSDDRLHACISELGVPLSREQGFHQFDVRGNAHGLLSSHPIAPFVSIHHLEAVDPFYPGLSSLDSLKLFARAMTADPLSFLQRSICYDHARHLSFSISLGYAIQVFPNIELPRVLERSECTYSAWNKISHRHEFDLDTRDPHRSICQRPVLFFLKDIARHGNTTLGSYARTRTKDDFKRKVLCFPRSPPVPYVENIQVFGYSVSKKWHLVPRRLCCKLNRTSDELLTVYVEQCGKRSSGSFMDSI